MPTETRSPSGPAAGPGSIKMKLKVREGHAVKSK